MKVFALSDLHLSFGSDKPMDIFGAHWEDHPARIREAWERSVSADDVVLVPGDISWAMKLHEAGADLLLVSNEVGLGLVPEYPLGRAYRDALGRANQRLAAAADRVYVLIAGLPVEVKALAAQVTR